jgi:hypothetical protein
MPRNRHGKDGVEGPPSVKLMDENLPVSIGGKI